MIRATSPGLPPWPKLWFDSDKKRAMVNVRHATWRSYEWSYRVTELIVWIINYCIVAIAWRLFETPNLILRFFLVLVAAMICFPIATLATRTTLRGMFARQIFATRTQFWVTETSIIFKSRMYVSPVVVWRKWNDRAIGTRLIVQSDPDAAMYLAECNPNRKWPRTPLNEANVIGLVIATPSDRHSTQATNNERLRRSIAISEVSSRHAQKFSTVFSGALMLVPMEDKSNNVPDPATGVDIDASN